MLKAFIDESGEIRILPNLHLALQNIHGRFVMLKGTVHTGRGPAPVVEPEPVIEAFPELPFGGLDAVEVDASHVTTTPVDQEIETIVMHSIATVPTIPSDLQTPDPAADIEPQGPIDPAATTDTADAPIVDDDQLIENTVADDGNNSATDLDKALATEPVDRVARMFTKAQLLKFAATVTDAQLQRKSRTQIVQAYVAAKEAAQNG